MADNFLIKTRVDLGQCIETGGRLALERYPALHQILTAAGAERAASLFAEPLISRGNDTAPPSISWYTDLAGEGVPLAKVDEAGQRAAQSVLSSALRTLRGLLDDPDDGPLVAAALHVASPDDILVVDGQPVIVNWGMYAAPDATGAEARAAQFDRSLGRFLPLGAAPPLDAAERAARAEARGASGAPVGVAAVAAAAGPETPPEVAVPPADAAAVPPVTPPPGATVIREERPARAWWSLAALLLIAALVLGWLLVPGSRLFFPDRTALAISEIEAERLARDVNAALEERRDALRASIAGAVCRLEDGTLILPEGRTIEGLLPPEPGNPADGPGTRTAAAPEAMLPPDPARVQVPGASGTDVVSLVSHLEGRSVLVLALGDDAGGTGSGFFVGPDLVVTNNHVVNESGPVRVYVTNAALGELHEATVVKTDGPLEQTGRDFALLRVEGAAQDFFPIYDQQSSLKLQSVISAGYPSDVLETDAAYEALLAGDTRSVPSLTLTDGTVSNEQSMGERTSVLVHSAAVSQGNSGGPLVDMCGRVVGVNTFARQGPMLSRNFALSVADLLDFLQGTDAQPRVVTQPCAPQVLRPVAPIQAAAE